MTKPTLLVLAAGMGSRYGGLKQIDPVGPSGEIILDYSIYDALKSGFGKVVFIIRKDIEKDFRECVSSKWENKVEVEYAFQDLADLPAPFTVPEGRVKPWGTGHAIMCAASKINEPFAAINADDFYGRSAYAALADAFKEDAADDQHYMVGFELRRTLSEFGSVARGICVTDEGAHRVVKRLQVFAHIDVVRDKNSPAAHSEEQLATHRSYPPSLNKTITLQRLQVTKTDIEIEEGIKIDSDVWVYRDVIHNIVAKIGSIGVVLHRSRSTRIHHLRKATFARKEDAELLSRFKRV